MTMNEKEEEKELFFSLFATFLLFCCYLCVYFNTSFALLMHDFTAQDMQRQIENRPPHYILSKNCIRLEDLIHAFIALFRDSHESRLFKRCRWMDCQSSQMPAPHRKRTQVSV
jgi:hypothetical protein